MEDEVEKVSYEIDGEDRIDLVSDAWDRFAHSGDASELTQTNIIGRSLWEFVSGEMVVSIYKQMLVAVRSGTSMLIDFRCDSPDRRRFLELSISPTLNGGVRFETITKRIELRPAEDTFSFTTECAECVIVSCSWCKKIRTSDKEWHEVEKAVEMLQLFELTPIPQLSHGMCENCLDLVTREIKNQS